MLRIIKYLFLLFVAIGILNKIGSCVFSESDANDGNHATQKIQPKKDVQPLLTEKPSDSNVPSQNNKEETNSQGSPIDELGPIEEYIKLFDESRLSRSITSLDEEVRTIQQNAFKVQKMVWNAKDNPDSQPKVRTLEKKYVSFQKSVFPKIRRAYSNILNSQLSEIDAKGYVSGANNNTLTLIGNEFVRSGSIKSTHERISYILESYRFKRVNYKYSQNQSEFSYYILDSKSDSTLF